MVFRFGVFEADPQTGELRKAGTRVRLQEQPWQALLILLDNAGQIVGREELRRRLWASDTFVDFDHSLNIAINKIRDTLDDTAAQPRFIETIPRRGYRFIAPVERIPIDSAPPQVVEARRPGPFQIRRTSLAAAILILTVVGVAARAVFVRRASRPAYAIAVLPLRNLSASPDTEYFGDGLTDEIIYNLSLIEGLQVRSRTSSFEFKGRTIDVHELGRQLQADLLLEGSVLRTADRVRLDVALVRVSDDVTLWSERYDREVRDIFTIQEEISRAIVNELRLNGVGGRRRYRTDPDTYDLYLRALSLSGENAPGYAAQLEHAVALFQEVTTRDPQFAPAYAAAAEAWAHLENRGRSRESIEQLEAATDRAIALDPLLPLAQATLGHVRARELRWQDAEAAFRRAIALDPNLGSARGDFAIFVLEPQGRHAEAQAQIRIAMNLDPLSSTHRHQLALALLRAGAYEQALEVSNAALAANPSDSSMGQLQARALLALGKVDQAIGILEQLGPPSHGYLGYAYARVNRRREAEELAAEDDPAAARHKVLIYLALGDRERCFEALEELARADDVMADLYPGEPELAPLRNEPRMQAFRRARNLPPN